MKSIGSEIRKRICLQIDRELLPKACKFVKTTIVSRTASGKDIHGRAFRKRKKQTSKKMLGSIPESIEIKRIKWNSWKLVFPKLRRNGISKEYLALIHDLGLGNTPKREFFGIRADSPEFRKLIEISRNNLKI